MRAKHSLAFAAAVLALLLVSVRQSAADDSIAGARDLYAQAAYEESLAVLNRLRALGQPPDQEMTIDQYRAFCLLALGRSEEARVTIESIVRANPAYRPADADVSPRVRTAFSEVRQRLLPDIIQRRYTEAKTAYDKKNYAAAAKGFGDVMALLHDSDVGASASEPPLSDLGTLAGGFAELSAKALAPPPPPPPPVQPAAAPAKPAPPRIYAPTDANVVAPIAIRQELPPFTGARVPTTSGELEVIIDETGMVETATMRVAVNPAYDRAALTAASKWRYQPATLDGKPVKFRKIIQITFRSGS